jgi:two-component system, NarL family, nitrate/nitrite response regulator NarL
MAGPMSEIIERSEPSLRILIVTDVKLYRDALALRLSQSRGITVIGAVHSIDGIEAIDRSRPDVALYDVHDWSSLERAQSIAQQRRDLRIVAIAVPEIAGHAIAAMSSGIAGCISRTESIDDVIALIMRLAEHRNGAPTALEAVMLHRGGADRSGKSKTSASELTMRESEILRMIERGLSNKEIARGLGIEVGTVKNHVHNILEKLNVRRRDQAAHHMRQSFSE